MSFFECNLLYSLYSLPNFILPFIGGIIVDKYIGKRFGILMFTIIIGIGQFLFSLSTSIVKLNE